MKKHSNSPLALLPAIQKAALLCLCLWCARATAQPEFDQRMTFDQIQTTLREGIAQRDLRKQALAWYHWAYYDETQVGLADSAFQYLARSAERFAKAKDSLAYQRVQSDLADRLAEQGMTEEARRMHQQALAYFQAHQNDLFEAYQLARLARVCLMQDDTIAALLYRKQLRAKNELLKDTLLEVRATLDEALHLRNKWQHNKARFNAENALRLAERCNYHMLANQARILIGECYYLDRDYRSAIAQLKKAEQATQRADELLRHDIYHFMALSYAALDSLAPAYAYAIRYAELSDTLNNRNQERAIQRLTLQFDTRQKRLTIQNLEREKKDVETRAQGHRLTAAALAVALCAVVLALFFIVRDYRHRMHTNQVIIAQNEQLNAQKIRELQDKLELDTMHSMLSGQEGERQRIAQDLHDSVGGLLAAAKISVENLAAHNAALAKSPEIGKVRTLLNETASEIRSIARNMQPSALSEFGLVQALRDVVNRVRGEGMPNVVFEHFGDCSDLDHTTALNAYRIVQELLQNSLKHANASEILVQVTRTPGQLALLVEDDGQGFDPNTVQHGMGTGNVAHRIQFLKGEQNVQAAPGGGASILVTIPLPNQGKP